MFHIRTIELVHWDYWQRFSQSLDASIVAIVGPNGSGKTTLLDALRTLFALPCSGKRDYKRYVRHADQPYAWIRAVVDNRRIGNFRHPFFPLIDDAVTLVCRVRKQAGDWHRQYLIEPGNVPIDERIEQSTGWLGVQDYRRRLESAGLTPAIVEVLALEQGETDRLCEYAPRKLLDLVFHVFGDKQVLEAYAKAREDQREAEAELAKLEDDLARSRHEHATYQVRADRYLEWRALMDEHLKLESEVRPRVQLAEIMSSMRGAESTLEGLRREVQARQQALDEEERTSARLTGELAEARTLREEARARTKAAQELLLKARECSTATQGVLGEHARLRALALEQDGADSAALSERLAQNQQRLAGLRHDAETARARLTEIEQQSALLQSGKPPAPAAIAAFRATLDERGIAHEMLSEVVEILDTNWQSALEALLAPYRHVVLLRHERDRALAWELGERLQYRHFVIAERAAAPPAEADSMLEIVRFNAQPPQWLTQWLNRIRRVGDAAAGAQLPEGIEWITHAGYHRERRGARYAAVGQHEFVFGEAARRARLAALQAESRELAGKLGLWEAEARKLERAIGDDRVRLQGMNASLMLAARAEEFQAAADRQDRERLEERRAGQQFDACGDAERKQIEDEAALKQRHEAAERAQTQLRTDLGVSQQRLASAGDDQQKRREAEAHLREGMPEAWQEESALEKLFAEYPGSAVVERELNRIAAQLQREGWEEDERVVAIRDKLAGDVEAKSERAEESARHLERARSLTDRARGHYIDVLRATVRRYGRNLRELGMKAGVEVAYDMPHLENDDAALAQAGLVVKFDFDKKGMIGLNDGEASGGQQVIKSLILLIALMMDEERPGGFVFIDEPFAHLDIMNIDRVSSFLRATQAQYLITTPSTHNLNVFSPVQLTLVTQKKRPGERWAPPVAMLRRDVRPA